MNDKDDTFTIPTTPSGIPPKKYIRTLAGDIETFQAGGIPDLALLKEEKKPEPAERPVEASPIIITEEPVRVSSRAELMPSEPILPEKPVPVIPDKPEPIPEPVLPPPPPPEPKKVEPEKVEPEKSTPLKTYSSDFSEHMKDTNASTISVLAAEQDAAPKIYAAIQEPEESSDRNRLFVGISIVLVVLGVVGIGGGIAYFVSKNVPVTIAPAATARIFVDSNKQITGTSTALMRAIEQASTEPIIVNTVRLLSLDTTDPTVSIFSALGLRAPGILLRNIEAVGSMAGVVKTSTSQAPFFIIAVDSYSSTFSGMLSWEPTILKDLGALFPAYPAPTTTTAASTTVATTTPPTKTATPPTQKAGWRDEVVSNHDVRVYRDTYGRSVMLYGYWNQKTLILARDPGAFAEILGRLATSRT